MARNQREREGDNTERRAKAKAARDTGRWPGEVGASLGSSKPLGGRRGDTNDEEVPAELPGKREAQDRAAGSEQARSPVDSMHVDAPNKQDNARGHARERISE